jgi:hypothetical protein
MAGASEFTEAITKHRSQDTEIDTLAQRFVTNFLPKYSQPEAVA